MKIRLNQMQLFVAISAEVERQAKKRGLEKVSLEAYQMNAIVNGANIVVAEFEREKVDAAPAMGLIEWLASDDTGLSSKAMALHIYGRGGANLDEEDMVAHPLDPADFGRCHRFIAAVNVSREQLSKMIEVSPVWAALVEHWDELTALYLEEFPSGKAPKLYARMEELGC